MRIDDLRATRNVEDRRGGGFGFGGGSIVVVLIALAAAYFFGIDPSQILNGINTGAPVATNPGAPRSDDKAYDFARRIVGSAEDVWTPILKAKGVDFQPATLTVYDTATLTSCGTGFSAAGPFYCPEDSHVYLDLSFFNDLSDRFGAPGQFAQAYVIAHEYGHHIQDLMGRMKDDDGQSRGAQGNSVRLELQADCYAGVWANHANAQFKILQSGDVEGGLRAASAVGDDTIEKSQQGVVVPDSFTHGTSAQRTRWFKRGLDSGDMDRCDTFGASSL
jgi:predicted metalloprotease